MNRIAFGCFLAVQVAAVARIGSEFTTAPAAIQWLLLGSAALWLGAFVAWSLSNAPLYVTPRIDGRPG